MTGTIPKPRLVFFQFEHGRDTPAFMLRHGHEHVSCLEQWFDVTVVNRDCDFQQVCDEYEPDLALFESGVNLPSSRRLHIVNVRGCRSVPRVGLLNADAWSETRAGILADMDEWNIDTYFTTAVTAGEHSPAIADRLYVWPNFVDRAVFRDYGSRKIVPVLITGSQDALYPWRQKVYRELAEQFPSMTCPHGGYSRASRQRMIYGEEYARAINASWCAPACGGIAGELVRKHFEIPGCRTCLIAPESPALQAAGFIDMKNCVLADGRDAVDKVAYLLEHRDDLEQICDAGYQLVHARHTARHRDQIFRWFQLHRQLKGDETIVQRGLFEPLSIVKRSSGARNAHIVSHGLHLQLLERGEASLAAGDHATAAHYLRTCLNYMVLLPEAHLKLAICSLHQGDARAAVRRIGRLVRYTLKEYRASAPDPVEWAYLIIGLLCLGRLAQAARRAEEFEALRHPELDGARWMVHRLTGGARGQGGPPGHVHTPARSVHRLRECTFDDWVSNVCGMLRACGQARFAVEIETEPAARRAEAAPRWLMGGARRPRVRAAVRRALVARWPRRLHGDGTFALEELWRAAVERCFRALRRVERQWGAFLPYRHSSRRNDEWFGAVRAWARDETVRTALVVGAVPGEDSTEAFFSGIAERGTTARVFCVSPAARRRKPLRAVAPDDRLGTWYRTDGTVPNGADGALTMAIEAIRERHQIDRFDAVLIRDIWQGARFSARVIRGLKPRVIMLDAINTASGHGIYHDLLRNTKYRLDTHSVAERQGYAVFVRNDDLAAQHDTTENVLA